MFWSGGKIDVQWAPGGQSGLGSALLTYIDTFLPLTPELTVHYGNREASLGLENQAW